jgi:hypothetical protein
LVEDLLKIGPGEVIPEQDYKNTVEVAGEAKVEKDCRSVRVFQAEAKKTSQRVEDLLSIEECKHLQKGAVDV